MNSMGSISAMDQSTHSIKVLSGAQVEECVETVHRRISERAFELFEREESGHGNDVAHWMQAEAELFGPVIPVRENGTWLNFGVALPNALPEEIKLCVLTDLALVFIEREAATHQEQKAEIGPAGAWFVAKFPSKVAPSIGSARLQNGTLTVEVQKDPPVSA